MANCPRCGVNVARQAKFCTGCGTAVTLDAQATCAQCGFRLPAGANFCTGCGAKVASGDAIAAVAATATAPAPEPEERRCSVCKNIQPRNVCGSAQSPNFQKKVDPKDSCDYFVLNPAQVQWHQGMIDALSGDRPDVAAAAFEAAISGGLPRDDEMAARFGLCEEYRQIVFNSGMEWEQCLASRQFQEAIRQTEEALKIDREDGYGYFAEPLNRARLRTFDMMATLAADGYLERGDRASALSYLQHKVGLCAYLPSCPLLNVMLKLGGLYADERRTESARICYQNIVNADPVDRIDEKGTEQGIRAEARDRLRRIS
jgi:hypothetical protein